MPAQISNYLTALYPHLCQIGHCYPHFDIKNQEQVNEAKKMSFSHVIYGLPNDAGIKITNDDVKIIGNIYVFKDGNMKVANKNITKKTRV